MIFNSPVILILLISFFLLFYRLKKRRLLLITIANFTFLEVLGIDSFVICLILFTLMNFLFYVQKLFNSRKTLTFCLFALTICFFYLKSILNPTLSDSLFSNSAYGSIGLSFAFFGGLATLIEIKRNQSSNFNFERSTQYLIFFPLVLAGPFIKPIDLIQKMENMDPKFWDRLPETVFLIGRGLFKKTLATLMHVLFLNRMLSVNTIWDTLLSSLVLMVFIFADFSGYSDIACGIANLCGIKIDSNFDLPYLAKSPTDFWRRWHISLNVWLRDYLYLPLTRISLRYMSGSPWASFVLPRLNILVSMLLIGLWHQISVVKIIYGLIAAFPLMFTKGISFRNARLNLFISRLFTFFYIMVIQQVLFTNNISSFYKAINSISNWNPSLDTHFTTKLIFTVACLIATHSFDSSQLLLNLKKNPYQMGLLTAVFILIFLIFGRNGGAFVYANI